MLNREERSLIYQHSYLPEHIPNYLEAVSGAEPHLHDDYLCLSKKKHLIFVGYPLVDKPGNTPRAYETACKRFRPASVAIIAPDIWLPAQTYDESQPRDNYYRLDLPLGALDPGVAYMVRRAGRELRVTQGTFGIEHQRLVKEFLSGHELSREQRFIFKRIPHYVKRSETARLLEARKGDALVAFSIVDMGSVSYGFYLFNFRSIDEYVPGGSDLLFYKMVRMAQTEGKVALNLGLGIHTGIRRFKEKWGGIPFLPYHSALVRRAPVELDILMDKL
ncbi:MAG: hypothetical protein JSW13_01500 [Candidatus Aerophobus sp.]|nr:MAG: hypothetical protein JSW13_01500 [Candidatus Aerophobus sp.]